MTRVDICDREDHETIERLCAVMVELGGQPDNDNDGPGIGTGLSSFRFAEGELTVFADAWGVDIAGPDALVRRVLAALTAD